MEYFDKKETVVKSEEVYIQVNTDGRNCCVGQ